MDFGAFAIIGIIYVIIGVRIVADLVCNWRNVWDRTFTTQDRHLVDQAAFYVPVPVNVLLDDRERAIAVHAVSKALVEGGFDAFTVFIAYYPQGLSVVQQTVIPAARSLVNLLPGTGVYAFVLLKEPA